MIIFLVKRLLLALPTLLGVAVLIFVLLRVLPGDVVAAKLQAEGAMISDAVLQAERVRLGLDQPLPIQFFDWLWGMLRFDFGTSMWTGRAVTEEIATRFPATLQIAIMATMLAVVFAIPLGALSAVFPNTLIDYGLRFFTISGLAVPSFWLGMLFIMGLLAFLNWLPPLGYVPLWENPGLNLSQLIWPALAVGYRYIAVVARMTRSSLLEVMREDYIRTARAKGVPKGIIVRRHAIRNAMLPVITLVALEFSFLLGGLAVTEQVFNINGLGKLFIDAVTRNDFIMTQSLVMLVAVVFILTNILIDIAYAIIDPRLKIN